MRKPFVILAGLAAVVVVGLLLVQRAKPHPLPALSSPQTEQPTIIWSVPTLTGAMFPGTSSTTVVTFRSNQNLAGVVVEATPSLDGIVSVSPMSFASLAANQSYQLTFTLKAPPEFKKREFGGTIHIRNNGKPPKTYAPPLTVNVRTDWNTQRTALGLVVSYPPAWTIYSSSESRVSLASPARAAVLSDPTDVDTSPEISISVLPNPTHLQLAEFISAYHAGWFSHYRSSAPITVAGKPAVLFSDIGTLVGLSPVEAAFVTTDSSVILITLNDPETENSSTQLNIFNQILSTLTF